MYKKKSSFLIFFIAVILGAVVHAELPPIRVLSIDGGGIRGLIPAVVLEHLEKDLKMPAYKIFDMVAGTSTGGILALGMATPNEKGEPIKTATETVNFYLEKGTNIFTASFGHWLETLGGLLGPKYEIAKLDAILREQVKDTMLSETLIPTLITGYYLGGQTGVEFFSEDAKQFPKDKDVLLREVGLATAAAPVFFDSVDVHYSWGKLEGVVDGGLYRHNPALLAYTSAKKIFPNRTIEVYSLGTGYSSAEDLSLELKGRGLFHWIAPIIKHITVGNSEADNNILHKFLNESGQQNFMRLNIPIIKANSRMDNAKPKNLEYLYSKGQEMAKTPMYRTMVARLKKYR